jgi:purine-binding chemotaxis protein CheW
MSRVHVRVLAGGEHYALPVTAVLEIADTGQVTPVPGAPAGVLGVRNLRGQVIPVIDLATMLGLSDEAESERIVVTEDGSLRAALAVTATVDVGELGAATEEVESPYLSGAILVDGALVGIVDVPALLAATAPVEAR